MKKLKAILSVVKSSGVFFLQTYKQCLKFIRKKRLGIFSVFHSLVLLVLTYAWLNLPFDYDAGEEHLTLFSFAMEHLEGGYKYDENFDSIVFINIAYDKVLVPVYDALGLPVGEQVMTDRNKITKFLKILGQSNQHKLVFFDIDFDEEHDGDSILADYMGKTKNFYLPTTTNKFIKEKSVTMASVNGRSTVLTGTFLKYPYIFEQQKSIPVKFFELLDAGSFEKRSFTYYRNDQLAFRSIVPTFYFKKFPKYNSEYENNYYDLGADLLSMNAEDLQQKVKGRMVLVGDFSLYDQHSTFIGNMPGTLILLNAYYNLKYGNNRIPWGMILMFFTAYLLLSIILLNDRSIINLESLNQWMSQHKFMTFVIRLFSIGFVFLLLTIFSLLFFNVYLNVLIIAIYFTLFGSLSKGLIKKKQNI